MKSTFFSTTKTVVDGTTAFSRKGFDSAKVIIVGGTDGADVKLQSGTSASQTDYATLGKSGGSGVVKEFDISLEGCGEYIKVTGTSLTKAIVILGDANIVPANDNVIIR